MMKYGPEELPDHHWVPTVVWDNINNKEWDCGYKFEIHPLYSGKFQVYRVSSMTSKYLYHEDFGIFQSIKEAKQAIADWKLSQYKEWEFKQKNPVIYVG